MADRPIFPERDAGSPLWTPGDRLMDADGNRLALQSELLPSAAGFSSTLQASGVLVTSAAIVNLLSINPLADDIKWLKVFPMHQNQTGGSFYYNLSGYLWIKVDVNPFLLYGARCAATAATIPTAVWNATAASNGLQIQLQTGLGIGSWMDINSLNFVAGTKRIDFRVKGETSTNIGFAIVVELYK